MKSGERDEAVVLQGVTLSLAGHDVLSRIDLSIDAGEFIGVLGPNGAGKTTLIRAILGLLAPAAGRISVLGQTPRRGNSSIGYMPQLRENLANLHLAGREFVAATVAAQRLGLPRLDAEGRRAVDEALARVGASPLAGRLMSDLSGGERQRLYLAQALVGRPKLLLLDEPLLNLDPAHQSDVIALVDHIRRDLGIAVLLSSHEINPLIGAIDQVLYLGGGEAAIGPIDEIISAPVLSRLYKSDIDVIRVRGRLFAMAGGHDLEHGTHRHDVRL